MRCGTGRDALQGGSHPSQAGNSKVGTATTGEAKSVRVMGHRHAISRTPLSLLRYHPYAILTFNFAHGSPEPPPPPGRPPSIGAPHPRRVLRCDLSALIIRRQESGQADDQACHYRKVAFLRRIAHTYTYSSNVLFIRTDSCA